MKTQDEIRDWLITYLSTVLDIEPSTIDPSVPLNQYGVDSTAAAGLSGDLSEWLGVPLKDSIAFDHPTIDRLCAHLHRVLQQKVA